MISISLCMIVKNEAEILARCLDSLVGLMDEIIIVDTGSTDDTKEIARQYTDLVYDFSWCDDFAAARNFSFSKATKEYIYAPDADEVLDETNRRRFQILKSALLPEIEIVTMKYITPAKYNTVQNASSDIRPKLFKRLRTFTWINPVHETVRLDPIVYDSDIEIQHLPQSFHGKRDFTIFKRSIEKNGTLPKNITTMYAKELLKCGSLDDLTEAVPFFEHIYAKEPDEESTCILARYYRLKDQTDKFFSIALKNVAVNGCSEVCSELGSYYLSKKNYDEASLWFYNAAFETKPVLDVETGGVIPLNGLAETYAQMANAKRKTLEALPPSSHGKFAGDESMIKQLEDEAYKYRKMAEEWMLPDE
ncbi:MAG: glycosyltransferase family 2 protein [Lachnobacterium sp.]|nr:glycosyltransferase family 2 protein [Lachnobacterium sp.]MDD6631810.1 glycosyltransferase family 2 protein [Lachnobacterium sp.]MDY2912311.1 glycosyltransferase family 2 protein [Agathobacter sp.]